MTVFIARSFQQSFLSVQLAAALQDTFKKFWAWPSGKLSESRGRKILLPLV